MQSKIFTGGFSKIVNVCCQNSFFRANLIDGIPLSLWYKPLVTLLRRNIKREWLLALLSNADVHVFPLEVAVKNQSKSPVLSLGAAGLLLPDVIKNYLEISPSLEFCGFGAYGSISESSAKLSSKSVLQNLQCQQCLCVVFFCPAKTASDWFHYWSRYRYRWWRKYSSLPSKFSMSPVSDQQLQLLMDCPWGKEVVETVTLLNGEGMGFTHKPPAIIICETELDTAALAYLINSFAEKWNNGEMRQVFHLHVKLAPYKVAFSFESHTLESKKVKEVVNHLSRELKKSQVVVFPTSLEDTAPDFKKLDGMGVPYAIILDDKAVQSGIAGMRNRDSTLQEQVHFVDLTSKLLKYLQMKYH